MSATLLVQKLRRLELVFDGHEASRRRHGATGQCVPHDGNQMTIRIDFPDRGLAEGFTSDMTLPEGMTKAGVVGAPEIAFLEPSEQLSH